jgi:hypothetical protein
LEFPIVNCRLQFQQSQIGNWKVFTTRKQGGLRSCFRAFVYIDRRPCLVLGVAKRFDGAFGTFWFAGDAEAAAVMDDLVAEQGPALLRNDLHEVLFDLLGIVVLRELPPSRDSMDVRVSDDSIVSLNQLPRSTFAVLRATPGSVRSLSISEGLPPKSATIFFAAPTTDFDLLRKKRQRTSARVLLAEARQSAEQWDISRTTLE